MVTQSSLHSIECSDQPLDLSFHPHKETLVAAALVDGTVEVHDFSPILEDTNKNDDDDDVSDEEDDTILSSTAIHTQLIPNNKKNNTTSGEEFKKASCRAVLFSHHNTSEQRLYTGGSAGDLCCMDGERVCTFSADHDDSKSLIWRIESASTGTNSWRNPIHVLHQMPSTCSKGPLIVSGDDLGGVRLWDDRLLDVSSASSAAAGNKHPQLVKRQPAAAGGPLQVPQGCVLSWKESTDYISALEHSDDGNTLLATSADGTLSVFDIRKASTSNLLQNTRNAAGGTNNNAANGVVRVSDPQDDELLSLLLMKNGRKVVAGTQQGVLAIWSWGIWGDVSDRFPTAHQGSSIDAMLQIDQDTILTGSSDGLLRVVTIHPDKLLGALGDHDGFPIESLEFTATRKFVGSVSHDHYIRLWDASILHDDDDDEDDDEKNEKKEASKPSAVAPAVAKKAAAAAAPNSDDEWEDMDEEDEEMKDDDDSDTDDDSDDDSTDDRKMKSKHDKRASKFKSKNEEFFADL
jgi:WD40 repeat protein